MRGKQFRVLMCSFVFSLLLAGRAYSDFDVAQMAAIYLLEEGTGGTAGDVTGNGHDGTFDDTAGTTVWAAGKFGGALQFNDTDAGNFAVIPHHADFDYGLADFSIGCWINATKDDANALTKRNGGEGWWTLTAGLDDENEGDGVGAFVFEGLPNDGNFDNYVIESAGDTDIVDESGGEANWHHIAVVRRSGVLELWLDGAKENEFEWNFVFDNEMNIHIGGWDAGSENLEGRLDEIFISKAGVALDEADLNCIMTSGWANILGNDPDNCAAAVAQVPALGLLGQLGLMGLILLVAVSLLKVRQNSRLRAATPLE